MSALVQVGHDHLVLETSIVSTKVPAVWRENVMSLVPALAGVMWAGMLGTLLLTNAQVGCVWVLIALPFAMLVLTTSEPVPFPVAIEVKGTVVRVNGRVVEAIEVTVGHLRIDGQVFGWAGEASEAHRTVLGQAIAQAAALRASRAGGEVPEALAALVDREP